MKRVLSRMLALYLLIAVIGRVLERLGVSRCHCSADCWCQRPILSGFRWVFPYGHR